jgi:cytoskeletal protein CcmA (bactofilin family)
MNDIDFSTVLGGDVVLTGDLQVQKPIRIDGRLEGTLTSPDVVLVGEQGKVRAHVKAHKLVVEGILHGSAAVQNLDVRSGANVKADLQVASLQIADGAEVDGKLTVKPASAQSKAAPTPVGEAEKSEEKSKTLPLRKSA